MLVNFFWARHSLVSSLKGLHWVSHLLQCSQMSNPSLSSSLQLLQLGTFMPHLCSLSHCETLRARCSCLGWDLPSYICGVDPGVALHCNQCQSFTRNRPQLKPRTGPTHALASFSIRTHTASPIVHKKLPVSAFTSAHLCREVSAETCVWVIAYFYQEGPTSA